MLKPRKWQVHDDEQLRAYYEQDIRIIDIAEAMHRTPDAIRNRAFILGIKHVKKNIAEPEAQYGSCIFCGQALLIDCKSGISIMERNRLATTQCHCPEAEHEARLQKQIEKAKERIIQLFGRRASDLGFSPFNDKITEFLLLIVSLIACHSLNGVVVQLPGVCRAKITMTTKGTIKVERSETTKYQLEE